MSTTYRPNIVVASDFARLTVDESYRPAAEAQAAELNKALTTARYHTIASALDHAARSIGRTAMGVVLVPGYAKVEAAG